MNQNKQPFDWAAHYDDFVWEFCSPNDPRCRLRQFWDDRWFAVRPVFSLFDKNFDPNNIPQDYQYDEESKRASENFRKPFK